MNKKRDPIVFGAKCAGVTFLFEFPTRSALRKAKAGARRLGLRLSDLLCWFNPFLRPFTYAPESVISTRCKFTNENRKTSFLKIQVAECDRFTRAFLERVAGELGFETIEEYICDSALRALVGNEEEAVLDPQTGEVVLTDSDLGKFLGCEVSAHCGLAPEYDKFKRVPIPAGAIVERGFW
jgi:hypothetical protein